MRIFCSRKTNLDYKLHLPFLLYITIASELMNAQMLSLKNRDIRKRKRPCGLVCTVTILHTHHLPSSQPRFQFSLSIQKTQRKSSKIAYKHHPQIQKSHSLSPISFPQTNKPLSNPNKDIPYTHQEISILSFRKNGFNHSNQTSSSTSQTSFSSQCVQNR